MGDFGAVLEVQLDYFNDYKTWNLWKPSWVLVDPYKQLSLLILPMHQPHFVKKKAYNSGAFHCKGN